MPVLHALWEILAPATVNELSNIIANDQLFGKAGLEAGVDDNWSGVGEMVANDFRVGGVDVAGGFETRPG